MLSVGGQEVSPVCLRIPGGRKVGQPGEDQVSKVEGILCDQSGLADAFQMAELRNMFEERGTDARRLQERRDPFLQVLRSQEDRKMPGDVQEQFRNDPLLPPQADPGEKAALLQALLDLLGGTDQTLGIRPGKADVDDQPVLDRVAGEDPAGVGEDGIILGQGGDEIEIELEAVQGGEKQPRHRQDHQKDERPP